jgi:hypothetical protein
MVGLLVFDAFIAFAQHSNALIQFSNEQGCLPLTAEFSLDGVGEDVVWTMSDGSKYSGNYQQIVFDLPGVYSVSATYFINGKEETITEERLVEVYPKPTPYFDLKTGENMLETIPTIGSLYTWFLEDGTEISNESYWLNLSALNPGEYVILLEETNSLGCTERTAPQSIAVLASN